MDKFSRNLAIRALNHWRNYNIPTYLGIRMFLQQVPKSESSNFLTEYLLNKLPLRDFGRYRHFLRFKGLLPRGECEYREMYAASPSTALSEAYALSALSEVSTLENKSYIYSYRWPSSRKAGGSFVYFYSGYRERNALITELLKRNPNFLVVANDIKSFYPSIDQKEVLRRLENHLRNKEYQKYRDFIENTCHQLNSCTQKGVPVGPALSHVLANLALEHVDQEMHGLLKERYLRYVDDIIMVLDKKEIAKTQTKLENTLGNQGFELHPRKHDTVSASEWLTNIHNSEEIFAREKYDQLINRLELFLWQNPSKKDDLSKCLNEKGIAMPIQRFAINAVYGRLHRYLKYLVNTTNIYKHILKQLKYESIDTITSDIEYLYGQFYENAGKIQIQQNISHPIVRKLLAQRLRFILNRLLYLAPFADYGKLQDLAPDIAEFYEYRIMIQSLITKSVKELVKIPGPAISSFASIFQELALGELTLENVQLDSPVALSSVSSLLAFGIVEPPKDWVGKLTLQDREYINFCMFNPLTSRVISDFSYEDELRSLQINSNPSLRRFLMTTRFSDLEQINFDTLMLGAYGT